ncbi:MAG: hypothetical protein ACLTK0_05035 [Anaerovoracaceae bacterium]
MRRRPHNLRIGCERSSSSRTTNILSLYLRENEKRKIDCVLIDECQFLKNIMFRNWSRSSTAVKCRFWHTA